MDDEATGCLGGENECQVESEVRCRFNDRLSILLSLLQTPGSHDSFCDSI
jgi:hypothetical protein